MVTKSALETPFWFSQSERLSEKICDEIIESGKALQSETSAVVDAGIHTKQQTNTKIRKSGTAFFPMGHYLEELLMAYVERANNEAWNFRLSQYERIQFGIYKRLGFYNWHADTYYKPNQPIRKLSVTVNLSDPRDYAGGNFEIKNIEGTPLQMPFESLRARGTVIVFPSFLQHRVTEVKRGTRYSLVQWLVGPDFV